MSNNKISFDVLITDKVIYKTKYNGLEFITKDALYNIVEDFDFYQHFHKVKEGDVVMDAGANNGYVSLLFAKLAGVKGKVYAFEPDGINVNYIQENLSLNEDVKNVVIEDLLLWNENTFVDFYEAGTVGSSAIWMPGSDKVVKKEAVRIDDWVSKNNIQKLDFIKMDIEGAEIEAMEGCVETIKNLQPDFAIASYHIVNGEQTYIKMEAFFKKMNYPYKTMKFNKNEIITFAGKNIK